MIKNNSYIMIISIFLLCASLGFSVEPEKLLDLSNLEGKDYVLNRDKLVVENTQLPVVSDAKLKLLSGILKERRSNGELFKTIDEIIQRSRVLREKMTDEKRVDQTRNRRYQKLGYDISKYRTKNVTALNMAMAELLWKMAEDDYERINALRVLSLNSCGIVGIFEVSHNLLQKVEDHALARELLGLISQYAVVYKRGDKQIVIRDIMLVSERFPKKLYIQERCLRLLKGVKAKDTQHLSGVISERIKAIKKEQREKIRRNKPVEKEVNITITGP